MVMKNKKDNKGLDINYDEDLDQIDFNNYKGMFFNDDLNQKYQDPITGAHFEYYDMCCRLMKLQQKRIKEKDINDYAEDKSKIDKIKLKNPVNALKEIYNCKKSKEIYNGLTQEYNNTELLHNNDIDRKSVV